MKEVDKCRSAIKLLEDALPGVSSETSSIIQVWLDGAKNKLIFIEEIGTDAPLDLKAELNVMLVTALCKLAVALGEGEENG